MKNKSLKVQIWEALEERGWVTPLSEPPEAFCQWWRNHDHCAQWVRGKRGNMGWSSGITARKAWMVADYHDEWEARKHENAAGTGVNYAYFGWWRDHSKPFVPSKAFEEHRAWCLANGKPDPTPKMEYGVPEAIKNAKSFADMKKVVGDIGDLVAKMDMNKAIGWTKEDSEAVNNPDPF